MCTEQSQSCRFDKTNSILGLQVRCVPGIQNLVFSCLCSASKSWKPHVGADDNDRSVQSHQLHCLRCHLTSVASSAGDRNSTGKLITLRDHPLHVKMRDKGHTIRVVCATTGPLRLSHRSSQSSRIHAVRRLHRWQPPQLPSCSSPVTSMRPPDSQVPRQWHQSDARLLHLWQSRNCQAAAQCLSSP